MTLRVFFILFFIASVSQIYSQKLYTRNSPEIPDNYLKNIQNDHRKLVNLNGEWNVSVQEPSVINTKIQVPFCYDFKGRAICTRDFSSNIDKPDEYDYILYCDGINYQCEISINGRFVEKHEGGFTSFSSVIQEGTIKETGNTIEIKVDNTLDNSKTLPLRNINNFPKNYGGIFRDIYILAVPKVFIKSSNVTTEIDINFNADIKNVISITATELSKIPGYSPDKKFSLKTEISDSAGNVKASSDAVSFSVAENSTMQTENKISLTNPQYWSPDYPYIYKLRVIISLGQEVMDIFQTDYGVYEFSQKTNTFMLNRAEIKLKGINYVEEFPNSGIAGSYSETEHDVKNMKALGVNIVKVIGRPASPYLVSLCNKYGLLLIEEIPVYDVPNGILRSENFLALAENQLNEMVLSHKNNPCIFAYGLGNDFDVTGADGKNYVSKMSAVCKKLDNKLVYYSTRNYSGDICRELVDMTGLNIYDMDPAKFKDITNDIKLKKERIFVATYGKVVNPSNFSGYSDPNSIEAQAKYIIDFYKLLKSSSMLGSFFLSYTDWNSDYPNVKYFDQGNQYMKTTGLFTLNREQRPPAIILRKEYLDEDLPNLNIGTYSKEAPLVFVFIGLIFFILFIYLANSVRRFRENVWRALFRPFIFFTDVREQNLIPTFHNFLLALILSVGWGLFFANLLYSWKDSQLFDIILSVVVSHDSVKSLLDSAIASPLKLTLILSALSFVKIFLISVVIWLFSLTIKFRITFNNIYTITVWGLMPTILLLVIGTFYIRVLFENPGFAVIGLCIAVFLYIVSLYRILKGAYILFDTFFFKTYAYGIATVILVYGGLWFYLNTSKYITDYFRLIFAFLKY